MYSIVRQLTYVFRQITEGIWQIASSGDVFLQLEIAWGAYDRIFSPRKNYTELKNSLSPFSQQADREDTSLPKLKSRSLLGFKL